MRDVLELIRTRVDPARVSDAPVDSIKLELTGYRAAHSMMHSDVCCAIINAIIVRCVCA